MSQFRFERGPDGTMQVRVPVRGRDLLSASLLNKGTAFTHEERDAFGIRGMLPCHVSNLEEQVARVYDNLSRKPDPLERYIGMLSLQDRNEVLYYRVLHDYVDELMPVVYTPTVGEACRMFSHIFRRGRGLWITPRDRGRMASILAQAGDDIRLICVTDNERILGLGDQGAGGMGIPVGKLALYTAAAGIHPSTTLPISLDVGTDNEALRSDPLYIGCRLPRLRGAEYDALVEEFVEAVRTCFPDALLQWEDFKKTNAINLLARYRKVLPSFNDDIQGTAAVGLAGVFAAARATGMAFEEQRIVILGAGAAGVGIAQQIRAALARNGLDGDKLVRAVAVLDSGGLLVEGREIRDEYKKEFAWPADLAREVGLDPNQGIGLLEVVEALAPTVLIGTSGTPGAFSEEVVRAMAARVDRPAVFPMSNPTSKSEACPADVLAWSEGRALVATGSPYAPVDYDGRTVRVRQGNNVYVFPGVGLGVLVGGAREVTEAMFTVAAETLAAMVRTEDLEAGSLFPPLSELRAVSAAIAAAVVREINASGLGRGVADDDVEAEVRAAMWEPDYPTLLPAD